MGIINRLERIELKDSNGNRRALGSFWAPQPVVLVFIRHFG